MCGIVGYIGTEQAAPIILDGLSKLEYRGYDSAGVALTAPGMDHVAVRKKAGRLANLVQDIERDPMPEATVGIGHTRWATNGVPNDTNAHPHTSRDGKVAIIHNGIIENASQLRLDLQTEGYHFVSETDTEVAAKLLGKISDKIIEETGKPDLFKAVRRLARMLEGAFTILATDVRQPDIVVGARHDSPLVVGLGDGENFLGSDVAAFVAYTKRAMEIDQDQAVMVSADKVVVSDFMGNIVPDPKTYTVDWDASAAEKGGWDSFMDKEIHEDPAAVQRTLLGRLDENGNINLDEVRIDEHDFKAIDKISFEIPRKKVIGVVGESGCGKSTLVNLIPRLYDVTGGKITLDGKDIRNITMKDLRDEIGFVPQKGVLFSGTIASNLRFGKDDATDAEIEKAAAIAQATEFIEAKDDKYETAIAQGGTNVSGGQKQRLAIARAIAKDPKIFIFDDSFSALDLKTDAALRKALAENVKDSTVIIVAQRISTILHAEQILVLDDGKVVGKGTHEELLRSCEVYQEIAKSQLSEKELGLKESEVADHE